MSKVGIRTAWLFVSTLVVAVVLLYWLSPSSNQHTLTVAGTSMTPTLMPGDKVQLQTDSREELKRGDLVAIHFKTRPHPIIKRIIAQAGDQVEFVNNRLKLNGEYLNTSWWPDDKRLANRQYKLLALQLSRYDNRVPKDSLIVMGDNSANSFDSGDFGMISTDQLLGRATKK